MNATVDVYDGTPTNVSGGSFVSTGDNLAFSNAGHTLTITDGNETGTVTTLGNITTVKDGGGTLIFDLYDGGTELEVKDIGTSDNRVTTVRVQNSGKTLKAGKIFAGSLTVNRNQILTADAIDAGTLTNNGTLTTNGGTVGFLGGSGSIMSSGALTIGNTTRSGFNGNINTTDLTVSQGLFRGNINVTGDFTANLKGNLTITEPLTVGSATFTGNGRADLMGTMTTTGNFRISDGATVALDLTQSIFGSTTNIIDSGATLAAYGEVTDALLPTYSKNFGTINGTVQSNAVFTDYRHDGTNIHATRSSQAHMSDGYLAAFSMHHRYTAWNMVRDRLISADIGDHRHNQSSGMFSDDLPIPCDYVGKSLWFNATGRYNTYRSSFNHRNWKTVMGGGQIGGDLFKTPRFQSGLLFGYEEGKSENVRDQLKAKDFYFGLYGAFVFRNGADARLVFAQGWQDYDLNRWGNANVLYKSSFKGLTSEANFEIGKRVRLGAWSLRPVLAADVYNNNLKAARETGSSNENIAYEKTSLTQAFFRAGSDLRHRTQYYTINSGIYYAYDVNGAELKTHARNVADPSLNAPLAGTKWGRSLLMFNLGFEGEIEANFSVFGGYLGECAMDSANGALQSIGYVGVFGKW
ncbi:MAG: autotransporter outer membrane beta-barrel domain-containing protein [Planctomycetaceae bacterium]|nr:autotransporter outer membrane beta-barrel domain-containing protein [Planctomycetaceae bacterium]